jgi:TetR/AcrR family transcriptional repressor of mexJK operon
MRSLSQDQPAIAIGPILAAFSETGKKDKLAGPAVSRRGRPSVQHSAELTRHLIACATDLFLVEGADGTTMEGVALRAGVPKTTLYKRFGDKNLLLRAVIAARIQSWSDIASTQNDALTNDLGQRLKFYCASVLTWGSTAEVKAFRRLAASVSVDEEGKHSVLDLLGTQIMVNLIADDIRDFGPPCGIVAVDPVQVATALMALIKGWMDFRTDPAPILHLEAAEQASYLVDLLLLGKTAW